tara:strand:- start:3596 stop:4315 length:720 start_codon:yes stop_codon:yes gene_type:complete
MFTKNEITKMIFFDVETATTFKDHSELSDRMKKLWSKRCEWLRSNYEDNEGKTDSELYSYKGALHPEFNKVLCVSFGRVEIDSTGEVTSNVHTCSGHDEKEVLHNTLKVFEKFHASGFKFVGHNIKGFDIPVILKRSVINGLSIPSFLHLHNLKPWEMPFIDTSDVWNFGAWGGTRVSLDLMSASLNVPTPKDNMDGSMVSDAYWLEDRLEDIVKYCEKDVIATANVVLKLGNYNIIEQ